MMGILILLAVFGYATVAGTARQLHFSEFDHTKPGSRSMVEEQIKCLAIAVSWPVTMPVMLGMLLSRRMIAKAQARAASRDRMAENGGIVLGSKMEIRDDSTYRHMLIALQKYEREKGYDERHQ